MDVDEVGSMRMVAEVVADGGCNNVEIERRSNMKVGGCRHQQNIYCK